MQLRNTWFGAVVAGLSQARPLPSGGKCCCIGSGAGLLAFASVFFADFGTVVGIESDVSLHTRAVETHRVFERSYRERSLDTSAPRPVEIVFYRYGSASRETLNELSQANVVVVDGTRVDSPHSLAAASADSCRPGTIVISLDISFPESDFEMLHTEEFTTSDWGSPSVTVRVQRRKGANRSGDPAEDAEIRSIGIDTSMGATYAVPTSPRRRPASPPQPIPGASSNRVGESGSGSGSGNGNGNGNRYGHHGNGRNSSNPMTTPQRLARNEATSHISSPVGSSLLDAKRRQSDRTTQTVYGKARNPPQTVGGSMRIKTPERPMNFTTHLSGSYDSNKGSAFGSLEASSPIGASLMMRKMRGGAASGGFGGNGNGSGSGSSSGNGGRGGRGFEGVSSGGGPLTMPSFSPTVGSPLSESLTDSLFNNGQPSSPMGAALLRRKQSGKTSARAGGPIDLSLGSSPTGSHSPLRRVIQHPIVPSNNLNYPVDSSVPLTEEAEAPSSPMSSALLRKKRYRQSQQTGKSPLRLSSEGSLRGGIRTKSGGKSPTFNKLSFFDAE